LLGDSTCSQTVISNNQQQVREKGEAHSIINYHTLIIFILGTTQIMLLIFLKIVNL
jgi:hypothetical protein